MSTWSTTEKSVWFTRIGAAWVRVDLIESWQDGPSEGTTLVRATSGTEYVSDETPSEFHARLRTDMAQASEPRSAGGAHADRQRPGP